MDHEQCNPAKNGAPVDVARQRQPASPQSRGFQSSLADIRDRAIRDASDLLDRHLGSRAVPWPDRQLSGRPPAAPSEDPSPTRRCAGGHVRLWKLPPFGTVAELTADEHGHLGPAIVHELVNPLLDLAVDRSAGDLLIDVANVESMSAVFLNLLASLQCRLKPMRRRLVMCGVGPLCAEFILGADLGIRFSPVRAGLLSDALARADQDGTTRGEASRDAG